MSTFTVWTPPQFGSTYIRWGSTTCPAMSTIVYNGMMAGPDARLAGGGSNYQCLPSNHNFTQKTSSQTGYSNLRNVFYKKEDDLSKFHPVPCTVCYTVWRASHLMIPARQRCPEKWALAYKGHLVSSPTRPTTKSLTNVYPRTTYECVDSSINLFTSNADTKSSRLVIAKVKNACSEGDTTSSSCPPNKTGQPLPCVVCVK